MEIARQVQERLLPQTYPIVKGLDFAGYSRTAQEVGGDYYDFIALENGRLGIAIAPPVRVPRPASSRSSRSPTARAIAPRGRAL